MHDTNEDDGRTDIKSLNSVDVDAETEHDAAAADTDTADSTPTPRAEESGAQDTTDNIDRIERDIQRVREQDENPYETVQVKGRVPRYVREGINELPGSVSEFIETAYRASGAEGATRHQMRLERLRDERADLEAERIERETAIAEHQQKADLYDRRGQDRKAAESRANVERHRDQLNALADEIDALTAEIEQLEAVADDHQHEYHDLLDTLEEQLRDGASVFPEHGKVEKAAKTAGVPPEDVLDDLRNRVADADHVTEEQFEAGTQL
ncbi:hypothetical protein [Natronorubrum sp. A-ect3]|uniref:hypothetical protein n=1 Tax=Natronorubrum sp. A-ect3 TaxID=3242698 RepID=UPI00359E1C16